MIGNVIRDLIGSVKEGMIGIESVKNISKGYPGEYVCGIGHIEVGGHCRMGLIYFLASSNNSPGIKNPVVLVYGDIVDDDGHSFPMADL